MGLPLQLMIALSTADYNHIISWTPEGDKFTVHNSKALVDQILPKYFKQCKFSSFLRKVSHLRIVLRELCNSSPNHHQLSTVPLFSFTDGDLRSVQIGGMVKKSIPQPIFIRWVEVGCLKPFWSIQTPTYAHNYWSKIFFIEIPKGLLRIVWYNVV